ncbi:MAG: HD domain-containing protein [Dehalococcoidia bacterium]|nr:MAG: HD domain-containing protein [Dehalococcoidia bacterium]
MVSVRHLLTRARYRTQQYAKGIRPHLSPEEAAKARAMLTPPELALFLAMQRRDQRHSLDLFHALVAEHAPQTSLVAALLHDVGKGELHDWQRIVFVLIEAVRPGLGRALEAEGGAGWRDALWRLRHHARIGAERLAGLGTQARVIELVAGHTSVPPADDPEAARFVEWDSRT